MSFDKDGNEKYIEVKTTRGGVTTPFYVTGIELERSKIEGNRYHLYRLYNFNEEGMIADFYTVQGDLSDYCINPTQYEILSEVVQSGKLDRA